MNSLAFMVALSLLLVACDDPAPASPDAALPSSMATTPVATTPTASANPAGGSVPPGGGSAPRPASSTVAEQASLSLLRLTLTSAVKDKEPIDELKAAGSGQRVWAHLTIRNRSGEARRISLIFRVDGEERSTVDLKVEPSWSFRTWGYNTLRASDKSGELTLEVRELGGPSLASARLPIRPVSKANPTPRPVAR